MKTTCAASDPQARATAAPGSRQESATASATHTTVIAWPASVAANASPER